MKFLFPICTGLIIFFSCSAQSPSSDEREVGGPCENCYELQEYGSRILSAIDTLPDFATANLPIQLSGTIYQADGRTPASEVILFIYQTNEEGQYQQLPQAKPDSRHFHYHRGWIKTGEDGRYTFYTFLPGAYPNNNEPRHIHPVIKEPGKTAYYIDDFVFQNDPLLTEAKRSRLENRGGSGIVDLRKVGVLQVAERDIYLGKNISGY